MHVDGFRFDLAADARRAGTATIASDGPFFDRRPSGSGAGAGEADRRALGCRRRRLSARQFSAGLGRVERAIPRHGAALLEGRRGHRRRPRLAPRRLLRHLRLRGRRPWASINFVTAHDGFTLAAISSATTRSTTRPMAKITATATTTISAGIAASRGHRRSRRSIALRDQQKRNFIATLLLSLGVPMLLAGDEIGRTQGGNNNAYCQDNEISWIDWEASGRRTSGCANSCALSSSCAAASRPAAAASFAARRWRRPASRISPG